MSDLSLGVQYQQSKNTHPPEKNNLHALYKCPAELQFQSVVVYIISSSLNYIYLGIYIFIQNTLPKFDSG